MPDFGPQIHLDNPAFIHPSVLLYGKVSVAPGASLWPHVVARSECAEVRIGRFSNVQDFVMLHTVPEFGAIIGDYCSITHHCTIHCCTIGDNCLIGINSTIMDGCVIGDNCIIGGNSFLKPGTIIPDNSVVVGSPGKVIKTVNNFIANRMNAVIYHYMAQAYARGEHRPCTGEAFERFVSEQQQKLTAEFAWLYGE